jgi:hypothetical protein
MRRRRIHAVATAVAVLVIAVVVQMIGRPGWQALGSVVWLPAVIIATRNASARSGRCMPRRRRGPRA